MTQASDSTSAALEALVATPKQQFLRTYEREHQITMRVLRAFPEDQLELRPHPRTRTARELAWVFVLERYLGIMVYQDQFVEKMSNGETPPPPASWDDLLAALETAHAEFGDLIRATADDDLSKKVRFFTGPNTLGEISRIDLLWFLLSDQIHHRGQFSIYLRMADGKVPAIYGPSGDEPWM